MVNSTSAVLEPTYTGYVATTQDALILFEACLTGVLHHVPRRPHDRERGSLVRSGSVFIYEENSSGIKRWTDGVTWSPSRILGNFLVYRELERPFPPGEKKRAMKKARRPAPTTRPGEPYPRQDNGHTYSPSASAQFGERSHQTEIERALVGSLVDSYGFKDSGLVKKTMSVAVAGVTHHLVSYYSVEDVTRGALSIPSMVDTLRCIRPRAELTQKQSFRAPIDDMESGMIENPDGPAHAMYGYRQMMPPPYAMNHPDFYMSYAHPPQAHMPYSMPAPMPAMSQSMPPTMQPASMPQPAPNAYLPAPNAHMNPVKQEDFPQSAPNTYLPAPNAHMNHVKQEDFPQFRAPQYGYEQMNHIPSSMPASMPPMNMPTPTPTAPAQNPNDRARSQSDNSQTTYRNSSISSRSVATDATSPMDAPPSFHRSSFPVNHMDNHMDQRVAYDPHRRESHPMPGPAPGPAQPYYGHDRGYYVGATAPGAHAHASFGGAPPLQPWTTTAPAQPQI